MLRLRVERLKRGLTQARLAALAGLHPAELSRIENGKIYPYPGWRRRLAEALGWPVEQADGLFEEVSEDETHS